MGVQGHGLSDGIGHLVETPVIHLEERLHDPSLDRLEAVVQMRDRPVKNHITCVLEKPVPVLVGQNGAGRGPGWCLVGRRAVRFLPGFRSAAGGFILERQFKRFFPACLMFVTYADAGKGVMATPDGRFANAPIADSAGPVAGRDRHGPTRP